MGVFSARGKNGAAPAPPFTRHADHLVACSHHPTSANANAPRQNIFSHPWKLRCRRWSRLPILLSDGGLPLKAHPSAPLLHTSSASLLHPPLPQVPGLGPPLECLPRPRLLSPLPALRPRRIAAMEPETRMRCSLCFSSDHHRDSCRLAPAVEAEVEEEDPEDLVFDEDSSADEGDPGLVAAGVEEPEEGFIPIVDALDYLPVPDAEDLGDAHRPDYLDVYMPHVHMPLYNNLGYAFTNPLLHCYNRDKKITKNEKRKTQQGDTDLTFILEVADLGCGQDRVALCPSSRGARVVVFVSPYDRENTVNNGSFVGREATVYFERHDETDNRFIFEHEALAALAIEDYPLEHWHRDHIIHSSAPYANPHTIDPICLTGLDFSAVLVTKAESIVDIPSNLNLKNHCSTGTIGTISIIDYDDLAPGSNPPSDHDFSLSLKLTPRTTKMSCILRVGLVMPKCSRPWASPLLSWLMLLRQILYRLHLGFFDIFALGSLGERSFFRIPMRRRSPDPTCKGLMVVNLATASVGLIATIARAGPRQRPTLTADILVRGLPLSHELDVSLSEAANLVMGGAGKPLFPSIQSWAPPPPSQSVATPALQTTDVEDNLMIASEHTSSAPLLLSLPTFLPLEVGVPPVRATSWSAPPKPPAPRRSSRLILAEQDRYISVVDKTVMRKQQLNEGSSKPTGRVGELNIDDLLTVTINDDHPLPDSDVHVLAAACDIAADELDNNSTLLPKRKRYPYIATDNLSTMLTGHAHGPNRRKDFQRLASSKQRPK
uniref:Uncharacterized protein n=1 Tax=Avena sativa TaxID=4498 RepID=A0ACD5TT34_AVESA